MGTINYWKTKHYPLKPKPNSVLYVLILNTESGADIANGAYQWGRRRLCDRSTYWREGAKTANHYLIHLSAFWTIAAGEHHKTKLILFASYVIAEFTDIYRS